MSPQKPFWSALPDRLARIMRLRPVPEPEPEPELAPAPEPAGEAKAEAGPPLLPLEPRVLLIIYNPIVDKGSGKRLVETMKWNDPDKLAADYIGDIRACSGGLVKYQIAQRIEVDEIPVKADGFQYQIGDLVAKYFGKGGYHNPDLVDYEAIVSKFNLLTQIANNTIDEVWLFGAPYFGFYESTMGGAGAFWCNAPPIPNTDESPRRFVVMGFNYQRGVGEMLEDLGHRTESIMRQVYRNTQGDANLFERFTLYNQVAPGKANVGLMHFAPNSVRDYDWGNPTPVPSSCDDWLRFPSLPEPPTYRPVTSKDWGNGDIRLHHQWWFYHLPRGAGTTDGISNFWWKYLVDPNEVD